MVSQNIINIILKAEDKASQVTQKVDNAFKRLGDTSKQANQKTAQSTQLTKNQMQGLSEKIHRALNLTDQIGRDGSAKFATYESSIQKTIITFNRLDSETQEMLRYLHQMSGDGREAFIGMSSKAQEAINKFHEMENATNGWNNKLDISKSKLKLMGTDVDSLKGKIKVVGSTIPAYIGSKFDALKGKVTTAGSYIKAQLGNAIQFGKSKVQSLGDKFSGLGGVISSVMGGIGLNEIKNMTIGLSMNREQVQSLTYATLGAGKATDKLWDSMDKTTTQGLVSLDELSQAMSVIKMSTGASTKELSDMMPVVNDIGQRAILMGRSGDEAISLMQAAGKGLNGEFNMLQDNFGITADKLKELGWSGAADDVTGYTKALEKYLDKGGSMDGMLNTTNGKLVTLQKNFRIAGRKLGDEFMPYLDQGLDLLNKWTDPEKGNGFAQYAIGAMTLASGFATVAPSIAPALMVLDNLGSKTKSALKFLGLMEAEEGALTLATLRESAAQKVSAATKYLSGVATATYGAIVGVLTGEISLVTVATTAWNAVMAANPIMIVVVALVALVGAVYAVGRAFGWWDNVSGMLDAIKNNIMRLWDAFINNPNVQGVIHTIGDAWTWLNDTLKPVVDWLGGIWDMIFPESATGKVDITRMIIDAIGMSFQLLIAPIQSVIVVLQILWPYLQQFYTTVLVPLGNYLGTVLTPVFQFIASVIQAIIPYVMSMVYAFSMFLNGQMSFSELLISLWTNLNAVLRMIFSSIIRAVFNWVKSIVSAGINAASRFIGGIINHVSMLPGRFAMYLLAVAVRIISAGIEWVNNARNKASEMVTGVISYVTQLPGKVYTEFMNIGSRIMQAGSDLVNKAKNIGKNIVDGMLGAMGIHSPGDIQEGIVAEFVNTITRVKNQVKSAYDTAKEMGSAFVDGFGTPNLNVETFSNTDLLMRDLDAPQLEMGVDTAGVDAANNNVMTSYNNLATSTGASLQTMVENDKNAYNLIRNNDTSQLNAITSTLQSNMNTMSNKVKSSMNNMLNKNKTGLNSARNTTKTQLNNITSATVKANNKMIESWQTMKNGIVSAADKIKSGSTSHFNTLEKTIGSFYRKLQNPGGFGAGPSSTGRISKVKRTGGTNGFKRIANVMRKYSIPEYIGLGEIRRNPFISTENIGKYITPNVNNKYSVNDLIKSGNIRIPVGLEDPKNNNTGAGSWTDGVANHVNKIKNKSKNWSMKGPKIIGKYATSIGFKVKDFINGTPKIDFATFKQMAQDVFSQCHYDFYYDSNKYGNWMTAFQHGYMNCSDSTDALIALAHACGLPASKVHGHWNKFGHYWANVAGRKMDTTGWMNQRNWTPAASHAGPAPKTSSIGDIFDELKKILDNDPTPGQNTLDASGETNTIEVDVTVHHEFENLPEHMDEAEVARIINETTNSHDWIKKLVKNNLFQKWDLKEKFRIETKKNRVRGV